MASAAVLISGSSAKAARYDQNAKARSSLRTAIAKANVNDAKGSFDGPERASTIDSNDQLTSADAYAEAIIGYKDGGPLRLRDRGIERLALRRHDQTLRIEGQGRGWLGNGELERKREPGGRVGLNSGQIVAMFLRLRSAA